MFLWAGCLFGHPTSNVEALVEILNTIPKQGKITSGCTIFFKDGILYVKWDNEFYRAVCYVMLVTR